MTTTEYALGEIVNYYKIQEIIGTLPEEIYSRSESKVIGTSIFGGGTILTNLVWETRQTQERKFIQLNLLELAQEHSQK